MTATICKVNEFASVKAALATIKKTDGVPFKSGSFSLELASDFHACYTNWDGGTGGEYFAVNASGDVRKLSFPRTGQSVLVMVPEGEMVIEIVVYQGGKTRPTVYSNKAI